MSTLNLENAIARLEELLELNAYYTKAKLKAFLLIDDYSNKVIKEALEYVQPAQAKATGFKGAYYAFLQEEKRTIEEAEEYIKVNGSKNVIAHLSSHLLVAQLALDVRASLASSQKEDTRSEEHKQAYKTHDDIKAKHESGHVFTKAEASKAHPDKVEQFNDSKLTQMYNELYKSLNIKSTRRKAA